MDRLAALLALFFLSPLLLFIFFLVRRFLGQPVFFTQLRVGYRGRSFRIIKFRTMTSACDASGALLPDCDRLTPFGTWLRALSIDELPALFNVLLGE